MAAAGRIFSLIGPYHRRLWKMKVVQHLDLPLRQTNMETFGGPTHIAFATAQFVLFLFAFCAAFIDGGRDISDNEITELEGEAFEGLNSLTTL